MKTAKEIAEMLGISKRHVNDMAANGILPALRVGSAWRFDPLEVRKALEEETTKRRKLKAAK